MLGLFLIDEGLDNSSGSPFDQWDQQISGEVWVSNGYVLSAPHGYQFHPQINTLVRSLTTGHRLVVVPRTVALLRKTLMLCIPSTGNFNAVPSLQCVDLKVRKMQTTAEGCLSCILCLRRRCLILDVLPIAQDAE